MRMLFDEIFAPNKLQEYILSLGNWQDLWVWCFFFLFSLFFPQLFCSFSRCVAPVQCAILKEITNERSDSTWNNEKYVPIKLSTYTFVFSATDKTALSMRAARNRANASKCYLKILWLFVFFSLHLFRLLHTHTGNIEPDYMLQHFERLCAPIQNCCQLQLC